MWRENREFAANFMSFDVRGPAIHPLAIEGMVSAPAMLSSINGLLSA
jgi:hypothetical protein